MRDGPTTLYRLYDRAGALLYIGISGNWPWRMVKHNTVTP